MEQNLSISLRKVTIDCLDVDIDIIVDNEIKNAVLICGGNFEVADDKISIEVKDIQPTKKSRFKKYIEYHYPKKSRDFIELVLPSNLVNLDIKIKCFKGEILLKGTDINSFDLKTVYGDIILDKVSAVEGSARTTKGSIYAFINGQKGKYETRLKSSFGDILEELDSVNFDRRFKRTNKLTLDTTEGNINLQFNE